MADTSISVSRGGGGDIIALLVGGIIVYLWLRFRGLLGGGEGGFGGTGAGAGAGAGASDSQCNCCTAIQPPANVETPGDVNYASGANITRFVTERLGYQPPVISYYSR